MRSKFTLLFVFLTCALFFTNQVFASESFLNILDLSTAQLGTLTTFQGGGNSTSLVGHYLPSYQLKNLENTNIGLNLGISSLHNSDGEKFLVIEYGGFLNYQFKNDWSTRFLIGAQSWTKNNGTALSLGTQVIHLVKIEKLSYLNGIYGSYNFVSQTSKAHEISLGFQFKF